MTNQRDQELKAFFKACEKNGIGVSKVPLDRHGRVLIIIGENGERRVIKKTASALRTRSKYISKAHKAKTKISPGAKVSSKSRKSAG